MSAAVPDAALASTRGRSVISLALLRYEVDRQYQYLPFSGSCACDLSSCQQGRGYLYLLSSEILNAALSPSDQFNMSEPYDLIVIGAGKSPHYPLSTRK